MRFSLLTKLAVFVALAVIATATIANWIGFQFARRSLTTQIQQRLSTLAHDRERRIMAYTGEQKQLAVLLSSRTRLRRYLVDRLDGSVDEESFRAGSRRIIADAVASTPEIKQISITNPDGQVVATTDDAQYGIDLSSHPDFLQGVSKPHFGTPRKINAKTDDGAASYQSYLTVPATTNEGRHLGVIMVSLDVRGLLEILNDPVGLGATGEVIVAREEGDGFARLAPSRISADATEFSDYEPVPAMKLAIEGKSGQDTSFATSDASKEVLVAWQPIEIQNADFSRWGMVVKIDADEALAPIAHLRRMQWFLEIGLCALGALGGLVLAKRFVSPIARIASTADKIAGGNRYARVQVRGGDLQRQDELGKLATAFNHMTDELVRSQETLEQRVDERTRELADSNEFLQRATEEAKRANRTKSEFLANMSHEIRTPMNGIIGMAELLEDTPLSADQREYLGMVRGSADSLLRILNDILDFSKIEAGKLELECIPFNLRDTVEKTTRSLGLRAADKQLELACRITPDLPQTVVGDPGRLRQIIVNLVGNAMKFTETGEIVVTVSPDESKRACEKLPCDESADSQPEYEALRNGDQESAESDDLVRLHFSVRDTGIGIPPEKQATIFDSFSQADASTTRQFGGTGLGLTISSQLVAMMDGRIWVESEVGKGTTFHFNICLGTSDESVYENAPEALRELAGLAVLVVDDNETNRLILRDILLAWHLNPVCVSSAAAAISELRRSAIAGEPYPLALIDCMMPGTDGFSLAEQVFADRRTRAIQLIMISSAARSGDSRRCKELGIARYMTKPVVQSDLREAIIGVMTKPIDEEQKQVAPTEEISRARLNLLLAEDGVVNQKVATGLLNRLGHEVTVVENGELAVKAWREQDFDAILMDWQMPVMDGNEATRQIRSEEAGTDAHIPIIAMTAAAMKGDRQRCLDAGMDEYLSKPIDPSHLDELLSEIEPKRDVAQPSGDSVSSVLAQEDATKPSQTNHTFQVIDIDVARERMGGCDDAMLVRLAKILVDEAQQRVDEIEDGHANEDAELVVRGAHTLKGAASSFKAKHVVEFSEEIEKFARAENLAPVTPLIEPLQAEVRQMKEELNRFIAGR